jgi:hypothetical protein
LPYTPKWERLSDALDRVMKSTSVSREKAEREICCAMADGAIAVRGKLTGHENGLHKSHDLVDGSDIRIPTHLKSEDLDWQQSRPNKPWAIGPLPRHRSGRWNLEWIELSKADITRELMPAKKVRIPPRSKTRMAVKRKRRETPKLSAVRVALKAIFPKGIPSQKYMLNDLLADQVIEHVKNNNGLHVSRDTVLRAAGRRK